VWRSAFGRKPTKTATAREIRRIKISAKTAAKSPLNHIIIYETMVKFVESQDEFTTLVKETSKTKLVVVDFTASWYV